MTNRLSYNIDKYNVLSLGFIIIQSLGIRFFEGQGFTLSFIVFLINLKNIGYFKKSDLIFSSFIIVFLLTSFIINDAFYFKALLYEFSLIVSSFIFLLGYRNPSKNINVDLYYICKIFTYYALIGYLVFILFPQLFNINIGLNKSLYYLFYVSNSSFLGFQRNTGIFWEPGVYQIIANYFLFYSIKLRLRGIRLLLPIIAVITSFSTMGIIILMLNILFYFYVNFKRSSGSVLNLFIIFIILFAFSSIFIQNTTDKFSDSNTSGLIRQRDIMIGITMIKEKPLFGHGLVSSEYFSNNSSVFKIEQALFDNYFINQFDNIAGGYTNGLLGFVMAFGIPISLLFLYYFFNNRLIQNDGIERIVFFLILFLSMLSSPISLTSFFLLFPLSHLIIKKQKVKIVNRSL